MNLNFVHCLPLPRAGTFFTNRPGSAGFQPTCSHKDYSTSTRRQDASVPRFMIPLCLQFWNSKISANDRRGGGNIIGHPLLALLVGLLLFAAPARLLAAESPATNAVSDQAAALAALSSTNFAAINTNAVNYLDDKYHLAIGDQISFQILEDEDPPVQLVVQDSGNIQVPYIGLYPAEGKTCKELALSLKKELEKEYYNRATVILSVVAKPKSRGKIYIVGAVRTPGPQDISSDEELTVSKAILRAGGFTDFADGKEVRVTRGSETDSGGKQTFTVNVSAIFQKGKTENDKPVEPGDLIFVPERLIRF